MTDCGTKYTSELFNQKCKDSGTEVIYSTLYHHQSNSVAEISIGIVKFLWKKAGEDGSTKCSAIWLHRITPIDSNTPSPYELLFGRKPRQIIPSSKRGLASKNQKPNNMWMPIKGDKIPKLSSTTKKRQRTFAHCNLVSLSMFTAHLLAYGNPQTSYDENVIDRT